MRVTFIIKNITEAAHEEIAALEHAARFAFLKNWAFGDMRHCVSMKVGTSDAFRDKVELNGLMRGTPKFSYKLESRKGYKLATFEINK